MSKKSAQKSDKVCFTSLILLIGQYFFQFINGDFDKITNIQYELCPYYKKKHANFLSYQKSVGPEEFLNSSLLFFVDLVRSDLKLFEAKIWGIKLQFCNCSHYKKHLIYMLSVHMVIFYNSFQTEAWVFLI